MPITQSRMLSLISASEDYQQALNAVKADAVTLWHNVQTGALTHEDALSQLVLDCQQIHLRLKFPIESVATIADEKSHFRSTARRNELSAKRAERKRRRDGVPLAGPARNGLMVEPRARAGEPIHGLSLSRRDEIEAEAERAFQELAGQTTPSQPPSQPPATYESGTALGEDFGDGLEFPTSTLAKVEGTP